MPNALRMMGKLDGLWKGGEELVMSKNSETTMFRYFRLTGRVNEAPPR